MKNRNSLSLLKKLAALAILFVTVELVGEDTNYSINFQSEANGYWMVLFPAPSADTAFLDAMTAIDILEIECDGVKADPALRSVPGWADRRAVSVRSGVIIYQLTQALLQSWVDIERQSGQTNLVKRFEITKNAKVVTVRYQVRRPNGDRSGVMTITFIRNDGPVKWFEPSLK